MPSLRPSSLARHMKRRRRFRCRPRVPRWFLAAIALLALRGLLRKWFVLPEPRFDEPFPFHDDNNNATKKIAVFYNVYIPPNGDREAWNARRIVAEQLRQLPVHSKVYYNTIGADWRIPSDDVTFLKHYDTGFEDVTLQNVHDYCVEHPDESVVYIHSKGSFHHQRSGLNDRWRQNMMRGLQACRLDQGCNLCGLHVQLLPALHLPGNFWMAECSYVRRLMPPSEFEAATTRVYSQPVSLTHNLYGNYSWAMGTERYTWEHWVGSHPRVRPCDVSNTADTSVWWSKPDNPPLGEWGLIPRRNWNEGFREVQPPPNETALLDRASRLTEWNLLPGCLVRWATMYGELPPMDSWIWTTEAYPDHQLWKQRVIEVGLRVVERFLADKPA